MSIRDLLRNNPELDQIIFHAPYFISLPYFRKRSITRWKPSAPPLQNPEKMVYCSY